MLLTVGYNVKSVVCVCVCVLNVFFNSRNTSSMKCIRPDVLHVSLSNDLICFDCIWFTLTAPPTEMHGSDTHFGFDATMLSS